MMFAETLGMRVVSGAIKSNCFLTFIIIIFNVMEECITERNKVQAKMKENIFKKSSYTKDKSDQYKLNYRKISE